MPRSRVQGQSKSCARRKPPGLNHLCQHLHTAAPRQEKHLGRVHGGTWDMFMADKPLIRPSWGALLLGEAAALGAGLEVQSERQRMGHCHPFPGWGLAVTHPCPTGRARGWEPSRLHNSLHMMNTSTTRAVPPGTPSACAAGSVPGV